MDTSTSETLKFIKKSAEKFLKRPVVILFGSRARKNHQIRSDYDIAVKYEIDTKESSWSRFVEDIEENAPTLLHIDLVNLTYNNDPSLLEKIKEEGIEVE